MIAWSMPTLANMLGIARKPSRSELRASAAIDRANRMMAQANRMRARYDSAQTTSENRNHWSYADDLSARAANSLPVRRTIRRRARYETANNSYAAGMLLTLANDTIGTGPRLQMQTRDATTNQLIEREFACWCRDVRLAQKLRTARITLARDGEVFFRLTSKPSHESPVWLDIELLEGDQVTTPALVPTDDHIDGIWFDRFGEPAAFDILDRHPGDDVPMKSLTPIKTPAKNVIHWFREDRPGQKRGIPEITPSLPLYAMLRRFTLATITAAESAADHAGILSAQAHSDEEVDQLTPYEEVEFARGMLTAVPFGWKMEQMKAEHPTTTYGDFKHEIINEIARCLNMPYNVAAGNSAGYNYSSGRLDHQIYFRSIGITQTDCESIILDRLFRAWYAEAVLVGIVPALNLRYRPWVWSWDPAEDLDPVKSANARMVNLQTGMATFQRAYAAQGLDWQVEQAQQAEALGITLERYRELLVQKLFGAGPVSQPLVDPLAAQRRNRKRVRSLKTMLGV